MNEAVRTAMHNRLDYYLSGLITLQELGIEISDNKANADGEVYWRMNNLAVACLTFKRPNRYVRLFRRLTSR